MPPGFGLNTIPLTRFIRDMTVLQATLPALLKEEDEAQAGDIAKRARAKGSDLGSVQAKAAPGIRAVNQAPIVRLFVDEHPYILGAEFGGGARPTTRQFPPWRGKGEDAGYMLFPTIRERSEELFEDRYADIVQRVAGFTS
jgi:hypothetical protein